MGFVHFFRPKIQGLFKDFPGPFLEISRTFFHEMYPKSTVDVLAEELKKSLILAVFSLPWSLLTLNKKITDFQGPKPISKTFKARANPEGRKRLCRWIFFSNDTSTGQRKSWVPDGNRTHGLPDTSWLERSTGIWEAMGLIPVRDSEFFFVPCSCYCAKRKIIFIILYFLQRYVTNCCVWHVNCNLQRNFVKMSQSERDIS